MRNGALARLRRRSPVHGLDRRNLRPVEVLAQSVSTAAPAAGMATVPAIVATTAGTATVWSFVLATAVALAVGTCIATFTRRMAVAGSLYSLTAKGLGPAAAFACGAALLTGYAVLLMAALAGAALYTNALLDRLGAGATARRGGSRGRAPRDAHRRPRSCAACGCRRGSCSPSRPSRSR